MVQLCLKRILLGMHHSCPSPTSTPVDDVDVAHQVPLLQHGKNPDRVPGERMM